MTTDTRTPSPATPSPVAEGRHSPFVFNEELSTKLQGLRADMPKEAKSALVRECIDMLRKHSDSLSSQAPKPASAGGELQDRVAPWMQECFGPVISADRLERSDRFIEESLELVQACGYDKSRAHALVEYVYGRPVGHAPQEVGGVMVTLAALCLANGFDMHACAEAELTRINSQETILKIRAKQAAKPRNSALPQSPSYAPQPEER